MLEILIVTKVIRWIIQVLTIFIILRPRPRTYASTSPLLLLQLHQQQQLLSIINKINSTNHHLQHAKFRMLLQHLTSHAAYERSGGPPKRPCILYHHDPSLTISQQPKRPCILYHHDPSLLYHNSQTPHGLWYKHSPLQKAKRTYG